MALTVIVPPSEEPITLAEAKASPSVRVSTTTDNTDITALIKVVRMMAERHTLHALVTQTLELTLDAFPTGGIELPMPPLQSVTSVKYTDTDGTEQTMDAADYSIDDKSTIALIVPAYGETWPVTRDEINAVRVRFVAGFGAAADVPEDIKSWMKIMIGTLYDNPQALVVGQTVTDIPRTFVDGLIDDYRFRAIRFV